MVFPSDFDLREVYLPYDPGQWNADSLKKLEAEVAGHSSFWLLYRPSLIAKVSSFVLYRAAITRRCVTPMSMLFCTDLARTPSK